MSRPGGRPCHCCTHHRFGFLGLFEVGVDVCARYEAISEQNVLLSVLSGDLVPRIKTQGNILHVQILDELPLLELIFVLLGSGKSAGWSLFGIQWPYLRGEETMVPGHNSHYLSQRLVFIVIVTSDGMPVLFPVEDWLHPGRLHTVLVVL